MAEEQFGVPAEGARERPGWTRLFGAFKVALDYKKLLLAAAGILIMSFGWWLWSVLAFSLAGAVPKWDDNPDRYRSGTQTDAEAFTNFKDQRRHWNFLYRTAGPAGLQNGLRPDVADVADTLDEYKRIDAYLNDIREKNKRLAEKIQIKRKTTDDEPKKTFYVLAVEGQEDSYKIKDGGTTNLEALEKDANRGLLRLEDLSFEGDGGARKLVLKGNRLELTNPASAEKLYEYTRAGKPLQVLADEANRIGADDPKAKGYYIKALALYKNELLPIDLAETKQHGELRTWPWFEDRGPNPFLMATCGR